MYFAACLPLFQFVSRKRRGRRFVVRLGTSWKASDPAHRWDVLMSFLSFALALAIALFLLDLFFPLESLR